MFIVSKRNKLTNVCRDKTNRSARVGEKRKKQENENSTSSVLGSKAWRPGRAQVKRTSFCLSSAIYRLQKAIVRVEVLHLVKFVSSDTNNDDRQRASRARRNDTIDGISIIRNYSICQDEEHIILETGQKAWNRVDARSA